MGYTTDFSGKFTLSKEPSENIQKKLQTWWDGNCQDAPIRGYCQWVLSDNNKTILEWDQNEKFYNYIDWLKEVIKLLESENIKVSGQVFWSGESMGDMGMIEVIDNKVSTKGAR